MESVPALKDFPLPLVTSIGLPLWQSALLLTPAVPALVAVPLTARASSVAVAWRWARTASVVMLVAAGVGAMVRGLTEDRAGMVLRADVVGMAVLTLVSFVGWVVIRYSEAYLSGDPYERRYIGRLLATIAAVAVVVVANHLVVLMLAWTATSLAMHGLLTFFGDRPAAVAAAHKKFILARGADLAMLGAVVAFSTTFETLRIDQIVMKASVATTVPTGARIAIALVAVAALLKCAQLPFHGWLIQVMEAPTPVSALLHAGVVNLGGFILLRFAPVVDRAIETRVVLVVVGTTTAVIAALVMTTRISIKVSLAWSTCAQMGFMLMQCGLGIWEMALLHLLAHSLYKAHTFLSAGGVVRQTQRRQLAPRVVAPTAASLVIAIAAAMAGTLAAGLVWGLLPFAEPVSTTIWVLGAIVAVALVPLVPGMTLVGVSPIRIGATMAIPFAYFGLHELFGHLVPRGSPAPTALLVIVAVAFALLFVMQMLGVVSPLGALRRRLYPWIYGGLFLDEAFTRMAFALWAPPAPRPRAAMLPHFTSVPMFAPTSLPLEPSYEHQH